MALTNLASPVNYNITPVDFSPIADVGLAYAQGQQQQETMSQAQELMKSGDLDAMADFALANEGLGKRMFEMNGIRDEAAQNRVVGTAKSVLQSQSPVRDLKSSIAQGEAMGRDMAHSKKMLEAANGDPEMLKKIAATSLSLTDPKGYKSYRSSLPKAETPMSAYQSATVEGKKVDQELRREENKIRAMTAKANAETNAPKREKLEREIAVRKLSAATKAKEKREAAEDSVLKIQQVSDTVGRLLKGDSLESAAGFEANFPTASGTKAAGFEAALETLQSQSFLSQIGQMKGMGALSEGEGRKLAQAIGSISLDMSDSDLRAELFRIDEIMQDSIAKIKSRMGETDTGAVDKGGAERLTDEELRKMYGG